MIYLANQAFIVKSYHIFLNWNKQFINQFSKQTCKREKVKKKKKNYIDRTYYIDFTFTQKWEINNNNNNKTYCK